jgi:hypothetical protein
MGVGRPSMLVCWYEGHDWRMDGLPAMCLIRFSIVDLEGGIEERTCRIYYLDMTNKNNLYNY